MAYFISGSSATTASFGHIEIKGTAVNTSGGGGGITISNNGNNRVLTGDGSNAAANTDLTWNGTKLSMENYEITPGANTTFNSADEDINTVISGFGGSGAFTIGESKAHFISQNVGIGTTSPGAKLDILGPSDGVNLRLSDVSGNASTKEARIGLRHYTEAEEDTALMYAQSGNGTSAVYIGGGTGVMNAVESIGFVTAATDTTLSGTTRMFINSSGNVGIGISPVANKLHLHEPDSTQNFAHFTNTTTGTTHDDGLLVGIDADEKANIWNRENTSTLFATNNTQRMEISADGDVGIGVAPNAGVRLRVEDTNATMRLQSSNNGGSVEFLMYPDQAADDADLRRIKVADGGTMSFESYRGGSGAGFVSDLTLDGATGKVGIGTTTVLEPLTVAGNISGSGNLTIHDRGTSVAATIRATDTTSGYGLAVEGGGTLNTRYNVIFRNVDASVVYGGIATKTGQVGYWGIGVSPTGTLGSRLNVNGNVAIGNGYTGTAAPTNGMIVQGDVGIGTATPSNYDSSNDNLVVYGSGHSGITVASGTSNTGGLMFADGTSGVETYRGYISYNHSSDHLTLGASSSPIAYLKGGNVGIGTSAPDRLLHLRAASPSIMWEDTDVSGLKHQIIGGGNAGLEVSVDINNTATGYFRVDVGGTEKMRVLENGNVGIGTNSPSGQNANGPILHLFGTNATGTLNEPQIVFQQTGEPAMSIGANANLDSGAAMLFQTNGTNIRMVILEDGKVGIGDNTPEAKLEIGISDTTAYSATGLALDPQTYDALFLDNSANGNMVAINFKVNSSGAGMGRIILERTTTNDGDFVFQLRDPGASTTSKERMRIAGDGHITMGSTDTHTKINGLLTFTDQGSWTSETAGSIRLRNNILYMQYGTSGLILRAPDGANAFQIDSSDNTTFRGHVNPGSDAAYNLGSEGSRWANVFSADLQLSNEGTEGNEVDGTTGSWTIQEGNDDLYLLNRKNGKKYRFKLEEII